VCDMGTGPRPLLNIGNGNGNNDLICLRKNLARKRRGAEGLVSRDYKLCSTVYYIQVYEQELLTSNSVRLMMFV
jgi:hypothetical protein